MDPADNLKLALENVGLDPSLVSRWQAPPAEAPLSEQQQSALNEAKELLAAAVNRLQSLPQAYSRLAWVVEDAIAMLDRPLEEEFES